MRLAEQRILALTVDRPWSELLASGRKPIETRSWPPYAWMLGRYIAIHASTRWNHEAYDFIGRNHSRFRLEPPRPEECPAGVIAVAQLVGWVQRVGIGDQPPRVCAMMAGHGFNVGVGADVDWRWFHTNEFGWVLRNVTRFAPVSVRGKQKLWAMEQPIYETVRQRYGKAGGARAATAASSSSSAR